MTPKCERDADAVLQQGMSMTLLSMVRDNEHKTQGVPQGVPQGGTTNLETPQGVDKIKSPIAQDLYAKIGGLKGPQMHRQKSENPSRVWNLARKVALRMVLRVVLITRAESWEQQRGAENDWATSGELRLVIVKESRSEVVL